MSTCRPGITHAMSYLFVVLLLASCGGGGGGGGTATLVYSGNTSQAVVTTTNSSKLTANVVGGGKAASTITGVTGVSAQSSNAAQNSGNGLVDVSRRLSRDILDIAVSTKGMSSAEQATAVQVDKTQPCDLGNGTVRIFGPLDNVTGTGTVTVIFSNCLNTGVTLNGRATMRIDAFDLGSFVITDATISFARLTLRATGLSLDVGGSLHNQVNLLTNTGTLTSDIVQLDNSTGLMTKTANLVLVGMYSPSILTPTSFTATISGQVFDSVLGYVDVTTPTLLGFDTVNQPFPSGGQILLTGSGNRSIRATGLPATLVSPATLVRLVRLELDLNGDSVVDNTATLKWADLSGPIGADLGDDDHDGMHNSWEVAYGLNPTVADAALDSDGDTVTNLQEYMAGTDPKDASSHP